MVPFVVAAAAIAAALVSMLALAGPERADAAPKYGVADGEYVIFDMRKSIFGTLTLTPTKAVVTVENFRRESVAYYSAPVKYSKTRIKANFGSLGRINLRVIPKGKWQRGGKGGSCTGKRGKVRKAVLKGKAKFQTEDGSYKLKANRKNSWLPGSGTIRVKQSRGRTVLCDYRDEDDPMPSPDRGVVALVATAPGHTVVAAREPYIHSRIDFAIETREQRGKVRILKHATGDAPASSFTYAPDLSEASLSPTSAGIRGSAGFVRTSGDGGSWLGNLATWLPGGGWTGIAGGNYTAQLAPWHEIEPMLDGFGDIQWAFGEGYFPLSSQKVMSK